MVGLHHRLVGHGFGWTLGVGDVQEGLVCCGHKESDMTEWLKWTELISESKEIIFWTFVMSSSKRNSWDIKKSGVSFFRNSSSYNSFSMAFFIVLLKDVWKTSSYLLAGVTSPAFSGFSFLISSSVGRVGRRSTWSQEPRKGRVSHCFSSCWDVDPDSELPKPPRCTPFRPCWWKLQNNSWGAAQTTVGADPPWVVQMPASLLQRQAVGK